MPLVVDPVMVASSGAQLLEEDAVGALVGQLFPLADGGYARPHVGQRALAGSEDRQIAERLHELGAPAVIVTGGHGGYADFHLFDGHEQHPHSCRAPRGHPATHGAGCTHSATLAALLARGESLHDAAAAAREAASAPPLWRRDLVEIGSGEGPVDVLGVKR